MRRQPIRLTSRYHMVFAFAVHALLACFFVPAFALAQGNPFQDVPEGRLVQKERGFSIDLAGGFQLGRQQDGYYLLGSAKIAGLILVKPMPSLTAEEVDQGVNSGYSDRTIRLKPDGPVTELAIEGGAGKLVAVRGDLADSPVRGLLAGYLKPTGGGLLLFAVTSPPQWEELGPVADQMARGVKLFDQDPSELIRLWTERLSGHQLRRAPDESGAEPSSEIFHVCGDGRFRFQPAPEVPPKRGSDGRWEIRTGSAGPGISFTFADGQIKHFELRREEFKTFLNGERYFVIPTEQCPSPVQEKL